MMRLIYAYIMFLFRYQFKLSAIKYNGIRDASILGTFIYIQQWYACTISQKAPRPDPIMLNKDISGI